MMMNSPIMSTFSPAMARMHVGVPHPCRPAAHYLGFAGSLPSPFAPLPSYLGHPDGGRLQRHFYPPTSACSDYVRAQAQFTMEGILGKHGLGGDKDATTNSERDSKLSGKSPSIKRHCVKMALYA